MLDTYTLEELTVAFLLYSKGNIEVPDYSLY